MQHFSWRWRLTELLPYGVRSAVKTLHNWLREEKFLRNRAEEKGREEVERADTLVCAAANI